MSYQLTMLGVRHERRAASYGHGAPLRLRNEVQLGFKQVKWIASSWPTTPRSAAGTAA